MKFVIGLIVSIILNFIGVQLMKRYRKAEPKSILAYCILPVLYLIFRMLLTVWGFLIVFGLGVVCIIIFLFKQSIPYFKPRRYGDNFSENKIVEAEIIDEQDIEIKAPSKKENTPKLPAKPSKEKTMTEVQDVPVVETEVNEVKEKRERLLWRLHQISFYSTIYNLTICTFLFIQELLTLGNINGDKLTILSSLQIRMIICLAVVAFICKLYDVLDRAIDVLPLKNVWYKVGLFVLLSLFCIFYYRSEFRGIEKEIKTMLYAHGIWLCLGVFVFIFSQMIYMVVDFNSFMKFQFARKKDLFGVFFINLFLVGACMLLVEVVFNKEKENVNIYSLISVVLSTVIFLLERKTYIQVKSYVNRLY